MVYSALPLVALKVIQAHLPEILMEDGGGCQANRSRPAKRTSSEFVSIIMDQFLAMDDRSIFNSIF
jgi:hypothetical protein